MSTSSTALIRHLIGRLHSAVSEHPVLRQPSGHLLQLVRINRRRGRVNRLDQLADLIERQVQRVVLHAFHHGGVGAAAEAIGFAGGVGRDRDEVFR